MFVKVWIFLIMSLSGTIAAAQTPSPALLVLEKRNKSRAIVDPAPMKVVGRFAGGEDPHEIVPSEDGKYPYTPNYGAFQNPQPILSVADPPQQKALPAVDLGALRA